MAPDARLMVLFDRIDSVRLLSRCLACIFCSAIPLLGRADDPLAPLREAKQSLDVQFSNFSMLGESSLSASTVTQQDLSKPAKYRFSCKRFGELAAVRLSGSESPPSELHSEYRFGIDDGYLILELNGGVKGWPLSGRYEKGVRSLIHHLITPGVYFDSPWQEVGLGDFINGPMNDGDFSLAEVLSVDSNSSFRLVSIGPGGQGRLEAVCESSDFGKVSVSLIRADRLWQIASLAWIRESGHFVGKQEGKPIDRIGAVDYWDDLFSGSGKGLSRIEWRLQCDWENGLSSIRTTTDYCKMNQVYRYQSDVRIDKAVFGEETEASVRAFATALPEGRTVLVVESERQKVGWVVRDGKVVMDKGPLGNLSDATFTRPERSISGWFIGFNAVAILALIAYAWSRHRRS